MLFSFFILVLALDMGDRLQGEFVRDSADYQAAINARIAPAGTVMLPGEEELAAAAAAAAAAEAAPEVAMTGIETYNYNCVGCHMAGISGAPIKGNVEAWAPRIAQGIDVLKQHAIEGYQGEIGYMPALGGDPDLKEEEVAAAVEYMVGESS